MLVACSKCEWKAAFQRAELIAEHRPACPMPSLLAHFAVHLMETTQRRMLANTSRNLFLAFRYQPNPMSKEIGRT